MFDEIFLSRSGPALCCSPEVGPGVAHQSGGCLEGPVTLVALVYPSGRRVVTPVPSDGLGHIICPAKGSSTYKDSLSPP